MKPKDRRNPDREITRQPYSRTQSRTYHETQRQALGADPGAIQPVTR